MSQPQYAIMRFAKYKGPEITNIEAHNERRKEKYASNPDIDLSRSKHNFHLIEPSQRYRAEAERCPKSGSILKKHSTSWSSIKPKKQSSPPWCIWTRRRPICTFPLSR